MYQQREIHVSILTNPCNHSEKSMYNFDKSNNLNKIQKGDWLSDKARQWSDLGPIKKPSTLYPSSSTQAGAPLPSRASRGQWGQEETKRSLPHDRGGDQDRRQGLQQPVLVPGTPEDSSQEQKRGSRGERRPRRRSRKREPVVMGHNTGHSIQ